MNLHLPQAAINRPQVEILADALFERHVSNLSSVLPFSVHSTMSVLFEALMINRPVQAIPKPTQNSPLCILGKVDDLVGFPRKPSFFSRRITSMQFSRALWIRRAFESGLQARRVAWSYSTFTRTHLRCWVSPMFWAVHNKSVRSVKIKLRSVGSIELIYLVN